MTTIIGTDLSDSLIGSTGADLLQGEGGDDFIDGGAGDDVLEGGTGADILIGGSGIDTASYASADSPVSVNLAAQAQVDVISLNGATYRNDLWSLTVDGTTVDYLVTPDDEVGSNIINLVTNWTAAINASPLSAILTATADLSTPGVFNIVLTGKTIGPTFSSAVSVVDASPDDNSSLLPLDVRVSTVAFPGVSLGGAGDDRLVGMENLIGSAFGDVLFGDAGANVIDGGDGNDVIDGKGGIDTLIGGAGDDIMYVDDAGDVVIEALGGGTDAVFASMNSYTLADNVERLVFSGIGSFSGVGNASDNEMVAGSDDDVVDGAAGDDRIFGQDGNDMLLGGDGVDFLLGGAGNDLIYAGAGDDFIIEGGEGDDVIFGGTGSDGTLRGNEGNDTIYGEDGDDTLFGQDGNDALFGGLGVDRLYGMNGDDVAYGGAGDDFIGGGDDPGNDIAFGEDGNDSISSGSGDDVLDGGDGNDVIDGGGDADRLLGGLGNDVLYGGDGNDSLVGDDGADVLSGGDGVDGLVGGTGDDVLSGDAGDDTLIGEDGADVLSGGDGVDFLLGGAGNDVIYAGAGNDFIIEGGAGDDTIYGGAGDDGTLRGNEGNDTIYGEDGDDTLFGQEGDDTLHGGAGSDRLYGMAGNDVSYGGAGDDFIGGSDDFGDDVAFGEDGNDNITSGAGNDWADGGAGDDVIDGGDGIDTITGGLGNDYLLGGAGDDAIHAGAGNDGLDGGNGADTLLGGLGDDTYSVDDALDVVVELAGEGIDTVYVSASTYALSDYIERLFFNGIAAFAGTGNDGDNEIAGGAGDDVISGAGGNDSIAGHGGADTLSGGDGTDTLVGGAGDDVLFGDAGDDSLFGEDGSDILWGGDGVDFVLGGAGNDVIYAGAGNDFIIEGGAGEDTIYGGAGDDGTLRGNEGDDTIYGEEGDDTLFGQEGNDTLNGGVGSDRIYGMEGDDVAYGGAGDDFIGGSDDFGNDAAFGNDGNDTITSGAGDDRADGGAGDDVIDGGDGADTIIGGLGNDYLLGAAGNDVVSDADGGDDQLFGGDGDDTITVSRSAPADASTIYIDGGVGDDQIVVSITQAVNLTVVGGDGNDTIELRTTTPAAAGSSIVSLAMGAGDDTVSLVQFGAGVTISLGAGRDRVLAQLEATGSPAPFTIADFETGIGGDFLPLGSTALVGWNQTDNPFAAGYYRLDQRGADTVLQVDLDGSVGGASFVDWVTFSNTTAPSFTSDNFGWSPVVPNRAPTLVAPVADQAATEDSGFVFALPDAMFMDVDAGDILSLSVSGANGAQLTAWLRFDAATRTFSGTPRNDDTGINIVRVTATDASGASVADEFAITVANVNDTPFVARSLSGPLAGGANLATYLPTIRSTIDARDIDIQGQTFTAESTGTLSTVRLALQAWNNPKFDLQLFVFEVAPAANGLVSAVNVRSIMVDKALISAAFIGGDEDLSSYLPKLTAIDISSLGFAAESGKLYGLAVRSDNPSDRSLGWFSWYGDRSGGYTGGDPFGVVSLTTPFRADRQDFDLAFTVDIAASAPSLTSDEDAPFQLVVPLDVFLDMDPGDDLTLSATLRSGAPLPAWLTFDPATRSFTGTPQNQDVGTLDIRLTATDRAGASVSDFFVLTMRNVNDTPILNRALPDWIIDEGTPASTTVPVDAFVDVDIGDALRLSASLADGRALPSWLTFDPATRTFRATATNADVGVIDVRVTATDLAGAFQSDVFELTVRNVNDAPVGDVRISDASPTKGQALSATNTIVDADVGLPAGTIPVGYQWQVLSAGGTWSNISGAVSSSFTPTQAQVGSQLRVTASYTDRFGFIETVASAPTTVVGDVLTGNNNANTISGTLGDDIISGLGGSDQLFGLAGEDVLDGGAGNDRLDGGVGADRMIGGDGADTYVVDNAGDVVVDALNQGVDTVQTTLAAYVLGANIENLTYTGAAGFSGTGNALANRIVGGSGADILDGGAGVDTLVGGAGSDTYVVDSANDVVTELAGGGTDIVRSTAASYTLPANVEDLFFIGTGAFTGSGNAGDNRIVGGAGADNLQGQGGNDRLEGGDGNDTLNGGAGNDVLIGGRGADTLVAGTGNDIFVFGLGGGLDTVQGFSASGSGQDFLDISNFGVTAAMFAARVQLVAQGGNTLVRIDGVDTILVQSIAPSALTAAGDFILA